MKSALLILDMQKGFFNLYKKIYNQKQLIKNINILINKAQESNIPIIYIKHCGDNNHPLAENSIGFEFIEEMNVNSDNIIIKKSYPDAFQATNLEIMLNELKIKNIILVGLQTEYCIDSTCRRAYSLGYNVILVGDAHSTYDGNLLTATEIIAYHNEILSSLFVKISLTNKIVFEH